MDTIQDWQFKDAEFAVWVILSAIASATLTYFMGVAGGSFPLQRSSMSKVMQIDVSSEYLLDQTITGKTEFLDPSNSPNLTPVLGRSDEPM